MPAGSCFFLQRSLCCCRFRFAHRSSAISRKILSSRLSSESRPGTSEEAGDGLQLLKHATEVCINSGDAWYYRSLFEKKLGQASKADYSLKKARLFASEAMELGSDPFVLATGPHTGMAVPGPVP